MSLKSSLRDIKHDKDLNKEICYVQEDYFLNVSPKLIYKINTIPNKIPELRENVDVSIYQLSGWCFYVSKKQKKP